MNMAQGAARISMHHDHLVDLQCRLSNCLRIPRNTMR